MPESAREFAKTWEGFKGAPSMIHPGKTLDPLADWQIALASRFAEAYASSRVAALEQRIADAIAILDQAGDNRDAALTRLREVKG